MACLFISLKHAAWVAFERPIEQLMLHYGSQSSLLTRQMLGAGWCPSDLAVIRKRNDVIGQYYLSTYRPPHPVSASMGHLQCLDEICLAYNIDDTSYESVHATVTCRCMELSPDESELLGILQRAELPVITLQDNRVHVVEAHDSAAYSAISHVWSHGLGNPKRNSLPLC